MPHAVRWNALLGFFANAGLVVQCLGRSGQRDSRQGGNVFEPCRASGQCLGHHASIPRVINGATEAGVVVLLIPCAILFLALQKYYVKGFMAGSPVGSQQAPG